MGEFPLWGVGLALVGLGVRWVFPAVPRPIAIAVVIDGVVMAASGLLAPGLRPPLSTVTLALAGFLCVGAAVHFYLNRAALTSVATPPQIGDNNTIVDIEPPKSTESGNTIVGPTNGGNKDINKGGTAIGCGATASPDSVAIGANANAGAPARRSIGINLQNSTGTIVENNYAEGAEIGIDASASTNATLRGNVVKRKGGGFPPATGEFACLPSPQLSQRLKECAAELRDAEIEFSPPERHLEGAIDRKTYKNNAQEREVVFDIRLAKKTVSLTSEVLKRTGPIHVSNPHTLRGAAIIQGLLIVRTGKVAGPSPFSAVSEFLDFLASKLPS